MFVLWLVGLLVLLSFGFVLLFGAPYVPTLTVQVQAALELADLQPGQTLLELGCGDGKVLLAAARQGISVVGYELNPILAAVCWLRTRRYRRQVRIVCGNFFTTEWPPSDAIFTFLHPRFMQKLDTKIVQYKHKPVKLISFAFTIPGKAQRQALRGVYRYDYR